MRPSSSQYLISQHCQVPAFLCKYAMLIQDRTLKLILGLQACSVRDSITALGKDKGCMWLRHNMLSGSCLAKGVALWVTMLRILHQDACAFGCTAVRALDADAKTYL
jgi:hypothetical protein